MTEYRKADEWLKKIKDRECPYCEARLQWPSKGYRACNNCDFTLYGNPAYVAYEQVQLAKPKTITNENVCPECGHTDFNKDRKHAETVCKGCGLVLSGGGHYVGYVLIDYPFGHEYDFNIQDNDVDGVYI